MLRQIGRLVAGLSAILCLSGQVLQADCPAVEGVRLLAAGEQHVLVVLEDGALLAWGDNASGQLGDGTFTSSAEAPRVLPPFGEIVMLATGEAHSLALTSEGHVYAWGGNADGQVGNGTTQDVNQPTLVMLNAVAINAKRGRSFAVTTSGRVYAWGNNDYGELGLGDTAPRSTPTLVPGLENVSGVSAGWYHTLAASASGDVYAWGINYFGQLGNGTSGSWNPTTVPVHVSGIPPVKSVAAGAAFSLAVTLDGEGYAWGGNSYGQLGFGDTVDRSLPTLMPGLADVDEISIGTSNVLALLGDGTVLGWGSNAWGKAGTGDVDGLMIHVYSPVPITTVPVASQVFASRRNSYLVSALDGAVYAWGSNNGGQLLDPVIGPTSVPAPHPVDGGADVGQPLMIAAGSEHFLVLDQWGQVWSAGSNESGQLGLGPEVGDAYHLQPVPGLTGIVSIAAGSRHSLALSAEGAVFAWGRNTWGQVDSSDDDVVFYPVELPATGIVGIAAGWYHNLAIDVSGNVHAWGDNDYGQLGIGNNSPVPKGDWVQVPGLAGGSRVAAGGNHSHAVLETGHAFSWGENYYYQVGDGTSANRYSPVQIATLVQNIFAGDHFALLVDVFGQVFGWGNNWFGQLGLPASYPVTELTRIDGIGVTTEITPGYGHTLFATAAGQMLATGYNEFGQLGVGDFDNRDGASFVAFGDGPIGAGTHHSVAFLHDEDTGASRLFSWGDNSQGQLGSAEGVQLHPAQLGGCSSSRRFVIGKGPETPAQIILNSWNGVRENTLATKDLANSGAGTEWGAGEPATQVLEVTGLAGSGGTGLVAALTRNVVTSANHVLVHDSATGARRRTQTFFDSDWSAIDLGTLTLSSGSSLAVLARNRISGEIAAQVRVAETGAFVRNVFFLNPNWVPKQILILNEIDANPGSELAVLALSNEGQIAVMLKDAATNAFIKNVFFLNSNWTPIQSIVLDDISENGIQEIGLLAKNRNSGQLVVMVKDAATNTFVNNVFPLGSGWEPVKVAALPDENSNGSQELAVLAVNETTGKLIVQVRDALNGQFLRNLAPLGSNWTPMDMIVLPDIGGGMPGLSVLATRKSDDLPVIQTIEAVSGDLVSNVFLN